MHKIQLQTICTLVLTVVIFLKIQIEICEGIQDLELDSVKTSKLDAMVKKVCGGKIAERSEEEVMVDSESNRRLLWMQKRYISYDTLRRDLVPCDRPGASYYNCKIPGVANHYNRGCEIITRCSRGD